MKIFFKNLVSTTLFVLCFLAVNDFCRKKTQGFSFSKATSSSSTIKPLNLSPEELLKIQEILKIPFHFLERGHQCYAFESEDGNYILKLIKWRELELPLWAKILPSSWITSLKKQKEEKKKHDFESYQIANSKLKEETGLIYLHLEKTNGLDSTLHLYDPLKSLHNISADQIEFILQKKVELFPSYFEKNKENKKTLETFFTNFVQILKDRIKQNIYDSDISLQYNMGILAEKPVLFDIGNLTVKKRSCTLQQALFEESRLVLSWLRVHSPDWALFLENQLEQVSCNE